MVAEARLDPVDDGVCRVSGTLSLASVPGLRVEGDAWLAGAPKDCRMDLSAAEFDGSGGVALLVAWQRTAQAAGKVLRFVDPPSKLIRIARISGVNGVLEIDEEASGD